MHVTKYTCWPTALLTSRFKSLWGKGKVTSAQERMQVTVSYKLTRKQHVKVVANSPTVRIPRYSQTSKTLVVPAVQRRKPEYRICNSGVLPSYAQIPCASILTHPKQKLGLKRKGWLQELGQTGQGVKSAMAQGLGRVLAAEIHKKKYELSYKT